MTREHMMAIFLLAGIRVDSADELPNEYWPRHRDYYEIREANPWWLVKTDLGLIKIGWRKRVINIDWARTDIRFVVTKDEVTRDEDMVHAYSYAKAVEYMASLRLHAQSFAAISASRGEDLPPFDGETHDPAAS